MQVELRIVVTSVENLSIKENFVLSDSSKANLKRYFKPFFTYFIKLINILRKTNIPIHIPIHFLV